MRMNYAVRNIADVAIIDISGSISPGRTLAERLIVSELVGQQLAAGLKKVLVNLSDVHFIDSSGLGDLIGALRLVQSQGGQLHLCSASQRISELLYRTHLDSIMQCFSDEASALQAFSANGHTKTSAA